MMGSALFALVLGLGVALPFARSGKPVGVAFRWSLLCFLSGAVLLVLGLAILPAEDRLNGAINLPILLGVIPVAFGGLGVVMTAGVAGLRWVGFRPEETEQ